MKTTIMTKMKGLKLKFNPKGNAKKAINKEINRIQKKLDNDEELTVQEQTFLLSATGVKGDINWDLVRIMLTGFVAYVGLRAILVKEETDIVNQKGFNIWMRMLGI